MAEILFNILEQTSTFQIMAINQLEKIIVNESEQWIHVRGKNINAPLIIHVQAGPGLPIIAEANEMQKLLNLEENFLVVYWDQRGTGKSFQKKADTTKINLKQMTDDLLVCTNHVLQKYKKDKAIVVGYSIGATISLMAAQKDSSLFKHLFLVGTDTDIPFANKYAADFAINKAAELNNHKLMKEAAELRKLSITDSKLFQRRAKLLTNLGGIKSGTKYSQLLMATIMSMIRSRQYSFSDISRTIKGMEFCQDALIPEMNKLSLFGKIITLDIPVDFIHGKLDGIAPYQRTVEFYESINAPEKRFTGFDHSAHMPHYEESDKFASLIKSTF